MSHINNPHEYYVDYNIDNREIAKDDIYIFDNESVEYRPNLVIELDSWKICKESNINYGNNIINIENNNKNWYVLSYYTHDEYNLVSLDQKSMIDNILISLKNWFRNSETFSDNLSIENLYIVGILNKELFNIKEYDIVRIIFKNKLLESIEMTLLTSNNIVINILYNDKASHDTSFSIDSSIIPMKPIYILEYTIIKDDLGLVLSQSDKLNVYEGINLLNSVVSNSDIQEIEIITKDQVNLEIYAIENGKFVMIKKDISNVIICLDKIYDQNINIIKKNLLIKLLNFKSNNVLYLSKIYL